MLLFSPRWMFLVPGVFVGLLGLTALCVLSFGQMIFGKVVLDVGTMMSASMLLLIGVQLTYFAVFARVFAEHEGLLPPHLGLRKVLSFLTLEWGVLFGLLMCLGGAILFGSAFWDWWKADFQSISYSENLRRIIPASTFIVLGVQILFGSFFLGVLGMKTTVQVSRIGA